MNAYSPRKSQKKRAFYNRENLNFSTDSDLKTAILPCQQKP